MNQYKLKIIEKLLNLLISMGWKPWGKNRNYIHIEEWIIRLIYKNNIWDRWSAYVYSLNDLCSIDSWLWQFVCLNNLQPTMKKSIYEIWTFSESVHIEVSDFDYEYRAMKSAIQEDKAKFILDNVKV